MKSTSHRPAFRRKSSSTSSRTALRVGRTGSTTSLSSSATSGTVTPAPDHSSHPGHSSGGEDEPEIKHVSFFLDNRLPIDYFKQDVLKLIHDLRIPKWRAVDPATMGKDIVITRISGALTNAVYCVEPPPYLKELIKAAHTANVIGGVDQVTGVYHNPFKKTYHYKVPSKLLLRVYGLQASELIDRDAELAVLARLSLRKIGPKLLGTFTNGRFEQFLHARPLTKEELRDPEVSVQIAKRMRELHDGIPLLDEERRKGPSVWKNVKSWETPMRQRLAALSAKEPGAVKRILGVDTIDEFYAVIAKYKAWLYKQQGLTDETILPELVFAHNDTQYGNLLRLLPPPGSPLLRPRNEHKQIVVIDFEYSGPNPRGFDIANQFCEWMSDYHDAERPHHVHEDKFPTRAEQLNLIQGYAEHGCAADLEFDDDKISAETDRLVVAAEQWRPSVNLHWSIWGIVQAVTDEPEELKKREEQVKQHSDQYEFVTAAVADKLSLDDKDNDNDLEPVKSAESLEEEEEADEFDYFSYSAEKAQLFWTDLIKLGVISADEYKGPLKEIKS